MPDPKSLKVGDRVRFVEFPEDWSRPGFVLHASSRRFMRVMIRRRRPVRVSNIDETGYPWVKARIRERNGIHYHSWMISETTSWKLVRPRRVGAGKKRRPAR